MRLLAVLSALAAVVLSAAIWAQTLVVSQANTEVRVSAPNFHFLEGKSLDRLRNGNTVAFDFQLSALSESKTIVVARAFERYALSYDLWEQTFSVARMRGRRTQTGHLTAPQAEALCVDGITLPSSALPKDQALWFRLEVHAQDAKNADPVFNEPGLSLAQLVDLFSRAARPKSGEQWKLEAGPIRLKANTR